MGQEKSCPFFNNFNLMCEDKRKTDYVIEGSRVQVQPLKDNKNYRERNIKEFVGQVGQVIAINSSYQSPDLYTVLFEDTQRHAKFFEYEVNLMLHCYDCNKLFSASDDYILVGRKTNNDCGWSNIQDFFHVECYKKLRSRPDAERY